MSTLFFQRHRADRVIPLERNDETHSKSYLTNGQEHGEMAAQHLVGVILLSPTDRDTSKRFTYVPSRRRPRSARYYQVFGQEPQYPCAIVLLQCLVGCLKCALLYGAIFLLIQWYVWPTLGSRLTKYTFVRTALNYSTSVLDRLRAD